MLLSKGWLIRSACVGEVPACDQPKGLVGRRAFSFWGFSVFLLLHEAHVTVPEAEEGSLQVPGLMWWCLLSSLMLSGRIH